MFMVDLSLATSWPFKEAQKLIHRYEKAPPAKGYVLFETGYGPSGLPHIGTFGEVLRTTMVRQAFAALSDLPTKLFVVSDDMDGLRKVPTNVPNQDLLAQHLGKPLTCVPDPFGTHASFGAHNNAKLREFLDRFGFDYTFISATEKYKAGHYDDILRRVLAHYDAIVGVILPTLGPDRRETYSPFLPLCPKTGQVLQAKVIDRDLTTSTITWQHPETGETLTTSILGGACKLQWKADWGGRWAAFQVDYEMSGKDLIDSVKLSSKICRILGEAPPETMTYELFLGEDGDKISKSKGNGLSVEDWLAYGPTESLSFYMFQAPQRHKRLFFDVIPKATDMYLDHLDSYTREDPLKQHDNPVWFIHGGHPPAPESPLKFSLLQNLAAAAHAEDTSVLWGFVKRYDSALTPEKAPFLDHLLGHAVRYYQDFIKPKKTYRSPTETEKDALLRLRNDLLSAPQDTDAEGYQSLVYTVGRDFGYDPMRDWFRAIYEVLLGEEQGPRFGSFIELFGVQGTCDLISEKVGAA
jgi:lysyl-tRNA synthetase class 1